MFKRHTWYNLVVWLVDTKFLVKLDNKESLYDERRVRWLTITSLVYFKRQ